MQPCNVPSIDVKNPLYCPAISATAYLDSLRRRLRRNGSRSSRPLNKNEQIIVSFGRILDKALLTGDNDDDSDVFPPKSLVHSPSRSYSSSNSSVDGSAKFGYLIPAWEQFNEDEEISNMPSNPWVTMRNVPIPSRRFLPLKRKRTSFSDIMPPQKYAKSIQSIHESSFEVSVRREKLKYSLPGSARRRNHLKPLTGPVKSNISTPHRKTPEVTKNKDEILRKVRNLEDELYGPPIGTESPRGIKALIERLDHLIPGVRLKERLSNLEDSSHQGIVDFLAHSGYLNARVVAILRSSEVERIALTESILDEDGLNICGRDVLRVFGKPNSFLFLSALLLSDTHLQDSDITYIHHLPKLSTLLLNNTAISNEAVFLLVPLKRTLTQLSLAINPDINDDAVPAILLLSKLSFLSILDTNTQMPGIRRLAKTIYDEDRVIDIEIPSICEDYIDKMHTRYLLHPPPPLITNPKLCAQLSSAALQRNLVAHAAKNPNIFASGSKPEMAERLRALLEMRKMDMLVRAMIIGTEGHDEDTD